MQNNPNGNVRGWANEDPGPQGHWCIRAAGNYRDDNESDVVKTTYHFSTAFWSPRLWYMYMQGYSDGNIRGWPEEPGPQGEFLIEQHPNHSQFFRFSPRQWPQWYVYVQNNENLNARGWGEGPAGDVESWDRLTQQGWWRFIEVD